MINTLAKHVVVNEQDGRKWVKLCDIENAISSIIDCRTCTHMSRNLCTLSNCVDADKYQPMVRLKCWKDGV